jgi:aldehyde dehydrogenase (NAD+)
VAPVLEKKLRTRMETLRMGDPLDKTVDMGAIVAPVQLDRIRKLVEVGRAEGAEVWQPSWSTPEEGWFYPPTLCTACAPAGTLAQVEIFGPVAVLMTFRTPEEAVDMANDTRYGLAASIWSENINLALDVAPKVKAGTVWINCTNMFDAASGFGGYRESGFGREGGKEGLWEYVRADWEAQGAPGASAEARSPDGGAPPSPAGVDRTAKLYVGGRQVRPDADASLVVRGVGGAVVGEVGRGNRKDIRNAVEAARKAQKGWAGRTAHNRAQILYYMAENLQARHAEFAGRVAAFSGDARAGSAEVDATVARLFTYAAWADKWDGRVHATPFRNVTLAMHEPIGVMAAICADEAPLLALVSCVAPLMALGNTVVVVPSQWAPLLATDLYQVLDTSDVPGGVVNIVTGLRSELVPTLAAHDDVDGIWYFGSAEGSAQVEKASTGNMKRTWVSLGHRRLWRDDTQGQGEEFLREATQVKNIWIPYGE